MDPAEAARAGTTQQPQQERLGLVVFRVRDGDGGRAQASRGALKERVPCHVRSMFDGNAGVARERGNVGFLDIDWDLDRGSEVAAELRVRVRLATPKLMVQMRRAGELEP